MASVPDVEPMPNPWLGSDKSSGKRKSDAPSAVIYVDEDSVSDSSSSSVQGMLSGGGGGTVRVMQYVGVDGRLALLTPQEMQRPANVLLAGCCPCFISCQPCAPARRREYKSLARMASLWLCVVNLAMLVAAISLGGFAPPRENYSLGPPASALVTLGAQCGVRIRYDHEVWRFATAMFLHSGVVHYLVNALATLRFCAMLERRWGPAAFCALYAAAGVAASILSAFCYPNGVSVGASGAICGTFGAYCAEVVFTWREARKMERRNAVAQAVAVIVVLALTSFLPHVDGFAHLGGLAFGFVAGAFVFGRGSKTISNKYAAQVVPWAALALSVLYFVVTLSVFFTAFKPEVK